MNRTRKHGWSGKSSAINKHLATCAKFEEIVGMFQIDGDAVDQMQFKINSVRRNTEILRKSDNWMKLAFLESLAIKNQKPELNHGIKTCKEFSSF